MSGREGLARLPGVDEVLRSAPGGEAIRRFGRARATEAVRAGLAALREALREGTATPATAEAIGADAIARLQRDEAPSVRPVFNLTGVVLHTNLGRAVLADEAVAAAVSAMTSAVALEYDVASGRRGERDDHIRALLCEVTGAEDAIVVNNNAAALVLVLAALAPGRETIVSRGELIEIGGAFRLPDIMASAGTILREVGTTNRTHARDYEAAIGPATGMIMKVHRSNFAIRGFTAEQPLAGLAAIARRHGVALVEDLGSGTLVDLSRHGLSREPTVQESLRGGADLVTFSGDKLLGGPQAGFIVGRRDLVERCARHPLKRAMRLDKMRLAALEATLRLYRDPDSLPARLPTLRFLSRTPAEIAQVAAGLRDALAAWAGPDWRVEVGEIAGEVGSGAMPLDSLPSAGLILRPERAGGSALFAMAAALRGLPVPVIGRIAAGRVLLDLRCLEDVEGFRRNLSGRAFPVGPA